MQAVRFLLSVIVEGYPAVSVRIERTLVWGLSDFMGVLCGVADPENWFRARGMITRYVNSPDGCSKAPEWCWRRDRMVMRRARQRGSGQQNTQTIEVGPVRGHFCANCIAIAILNGQQ
jgi:hypothetical protein